MSFEIFRLGLLYKKRSQLFYLGDILNEDISKTFFLKKSFSMKIYHLKISSTTLRTKDAPPKNLIETF